jgi:hypothetical protein
MRPSRFLVALIVFALSGPAEAQQPGNVPHLGFLLQARPAGPNIEGLREYGYVAGKTITQQIFLLTLADRLGSIRADGWGLGVQGIATK